MKIQANWSLKNSLSDLRSYKKHISLFLFIYTCQCQKIGCPQYFLRLIDFCMWLHNGYTQLKHFASLKLRNWLYAWYTSSTSLWYSALPSLSCRLGHPHSIHYNHYIPIYRPRLLVIDLLFYLLAAFLVGTRSHVTALKQFTPKFKLLPLRGIHTHSLAWNRTA